MNNALPDYNLNEVKSLLASMKQEVQGYSSPQVGRKMWSSIWQAMASRPPDESWDSDLDRASSTDEEKPVLLQGYNTTVKKTTNRERNWRTYSWKSNPFMLNIFDTHEDDKHFQ